VTIVVVVAISTTVGIAITIAALNGDKKIISK